MSDSQKPKTSPKKKECSDDEEEYCCPICESLAIRIEDDGTITELDKKKSK